MDENLQSIEVVKPGTPVMLAGGDAIIASVSISRSLVPQYEMQWWNGKAVATGWFYREDFCVRFDDKIRIGFIQPKKEGAI